MKKALKAMEGALVALHHSNWYEEYFYDVSRLLPIINFINTLSADKQNLTFIELFSHTGVISHTALQTLPQFVKAELYELDPETIQRGENLARSRNLNISYFEQDLGRKIRKPVAQDSLIYIGEESHELLHGYRQLDNLAYNCAKLCTPGSKLVIKWISFKDRHEAVHYCRNGHLLDVTTVTKDDGTPGFLSGYYVDAYDPLRHLVTYRLVFRKNGQEESYSFTMRYWTLSEITEAFSEFDFALYCRDGNPITNWHADYYDQELYLVGTRK